MMVFRRLSPLTMLLALAVILITLGTTAAGAEERGLVLNSNDAYKGYTLFAPLQITTTYLIQNDGTVAYSWPSDYLPMAVYLLDDGQLLRAGADRTDGVFGYAGGIGGRVQLIDPDGSLAWDYLVAGDTYQQHHDLEYLPNGNVLMEVWDYVTAEEAIAAGRNPDLLSENALWNERILEVKPDGATGGEVVWEWRVADHLIQNYDSSKPNYGNPADNPQKVNLNFAYEGGIADWIHFNAISYNAELDQILVSSHSFSEIWVIDHSTTTAQAATSSGGNSGHGGDLLYRWGNPQTYDQGTAADEILYGQHDAQWIPAGYPGQDDILLFNNGYHRPDGLYSMVDQITTPIEADGNYTYDGTTYGPNGLTWYYEDDPPTGMYSPAISGAQRQPNGNTLISEGVDGELREVTASGEVVWRYLNPYGFDTYSGYSLFKARRYGLNYAGLRPLGLATTSR